jgi:hypothetical protein
MTSTPRYSTRAFPAYRHVPGKTPHPTRAPEGHSFARELPPFSVDEQSWPTCEAYLYAIDLFNHGYYWEAHEALEPLWHGAGRDTPVGTFAQAVIQAAAALLKHAMGELEPATRLVHAAAAKLRAGSPVVLGVATRELAAELESHVGGRGKGPPVIELGASVERPV